MDPRLQNQVARGIEDTEKAYAEDIVAYGKGSRNPKKAEMIAREAGAFVNDLFSIGVEFTDEEDRTNGGEKLRVVKTKGAGGALMRKLKLFQFNKGSEFN